MMYDLYIGDRLFSSWSLRGWLMFEKFGLPYREHMMGLYAGTLAQDMAELAPARTVPAAKTPEGYILSDSLSMAETLAERHPDAGLWPSDPAARALARNLVCEMHSGFGALRDVCNMQISHVWEGFVAPEPVLKNLERIEFLWAMARDRHGAKGPWLFGEYSLADVFYAPVAMRIAGYGLPVSDAAKAYVENHLNDPAFLRWRAEALKENHKTFPYEMNLPRKDWPF